MIKYSPFCATCGRGYIREDNGRVSCGASVEANPIWATRKYGDGRVLGLLLGSPAAFDTTGMDCENMAPSDGQECEAYKHFSVKT